VAAVLVTDAVRSMLPVPAAVCTVAGPVPS
jgi:hypothetical protein